MSKAKGYRLTGHRLKAKGRICTLAALLPVTCSGFSLLPVDLEVPIEASGTESMADPFPDP